MLEDHLFEQILYSSSAELEEARKILQNIIRRRLYKCLGQTQCKKIEVVSPVCDHVFTVVLKHLLVTRWSNTLTLLVKTFIALLDPSFKGMRRSWQAELARTRPECGTSNKDLDPEDFVITVRFTSKH